MNEKIKQLAEQAGIKITPLVVDGEEYNYNEVTMDGSDDLEEFAELLLRNLAEELLEVSKRSKKFNPEWANGVDHAAMLAQRMTMNLPEEE